MIKVHATINPFCKDTPFVIKIKKFLDSRKEVFDTNHLAGEIMSSADTVSNYNSYLKDYLFKFRYNRTYYGNPKVLALFKKELAKKGLL